MRYVLLALTIAACSRSQAPTAAPVDAEHEVAPLADDVSVVDAADAASPADAVSPSDAPSAVTP